MENSLYHFIIFAYDFFMNDMLPISALSLRDNHVSDEIAALNSLKISVLGCIVMKKNSTSKFVFLDFSMKYSGL